MSVHTIHSTLQLPAGRGAVYGAGRQGRALQSILARYRPDIQLVCMLDDTVTGEGVAVPDAAGHLALAWVLIVGPATDMMAKKLTGFSGDVYAFGPGIDTAQCVLPEEQEHYFAQVETVAQWLPTAGATFYRKLAQARTFAIKPAAKEFSTFPSNGRQYLDFLQFDKVRTAIEGAIQDGGTTRTLVQACPKMDKLHAFEPCPAFFATATAALAQWPRVDLHCAALWSHTGDGRFQESGASSHVLSSKVQTGGVPCCLIGLDDFVASQGLATVDLIKLDVEGAELSVLQGAVTTMRRFRPQLAISIYHSKFDFVEVPIFLKSVVPEYVFRLGHYSQGITETTLYAYAAS